eukprot:gene9562-9724_t
MPMISGVFQDPSSSPGLLVVLEGPDVRDCELGAAAPDVVRFSGDKGDGAAVLLLLLTGTFGRGEPWLLPVVAATGEVPGGEAGLVLKTAAGDDATGGGELPVMTAGAWLPGDGVVAGGLLPGSARGDGDEAGLPGCDAGAVRGRGDGAVETTLLALAAAVSPADDILKPPGVPVCVSVCII